MRILLTTWDGAGNLPPALPLISTLATRGHEVSVLAHDSQEHDVVDAGGHFYRYQTASQFDQAVLLPAFDFAAWLTSFNEAAARDFMQVSLQVDPSVIIIDAMMGPSLAIGWSTGRKIVALLHQSYSAMAAWRETIDSADLSICCSYEDFDPEVRFPRRMHHVGPLRPPACGLPFHRKFPDRPLVVASLSTGHQGPFQLSLLQRICDALSALPVEAVVTTGRGISPDALTAAPNVALSAYIDHTLTLKEADLFVTHCGHGSIMAALSAGVPMLCLPPIADQPHNAALVHHLQLGEVLDVMAPAPQLSATIARMLTDRKLHKNAKKFAKKKTYKPKLDRAIKLIEKLGR